MSDQWRESAAPVEPYFDRTPQPFGDVAPDPLVYDASPRTHVAHACGFITTSAKTSRAAVRIARRFSSFFWARLLLPAAPAPGFSLRGAEWAKI